MSLSVVARSSGPGGGPKPAEMSDDRIREGNTPMRRLSAVAVLIGMIGALLMAAPATHSSAADLATEAAW